MIMLPRDLSRYHFKKWDEQNKNTTPQWKFKTWVISTLAIFFLLLIMTRETTFLRALIVFMLTSLCTWLWIYIVLFPKLVVVKKTEKEENKIQRKPQDDKSPLSGITYKIIATVMIIAILIFFIYLEMLTR